jgi:hypothetical protein
VGSCAQLGPIKSKGDEKHKNAATAWEASAVK